eukprot:TRINITY_DN76471_c0_g1_i1.p1 TRINITY_DN76471_c0_g1~~TRINITY_DN76471_c0_g1_i1.p1  ORF type:complete len:179 (+),score=4.33 TRINITY_DN76471_c0_g1_i1:72-539(+)
MPMWQMPDAIHVVNESLPVRGDKVSRNILRTREFRQAVLAADLEHARKHRQLRDADVCSMDPARMSLENEFLHQLSDTTAKGSLSLDKLRTMFGSHAQAVLRTLCADFEYRRQLESEALSNLLARMDQEEHSSFILLARSLLLAWAADRDAMTVA